MIITTTSEISGKKILEYKGIVASEVIAGVDFLKDMKAELQNFFGKSSSFYKDGIALARQNAVNELEGEAESLGANAIIGINIYYQVLGQGNNMVMVTVAGTAVVLE